MAYISQEVNIEMLEKLADGTYKRKYPKTRSDSGVTFDEHLVDAQLKHDDLKYSELTVSATNRDVEDIYVNTEWKRKDNTTYAKSTLLGTSPKYNQIKVDYYDEEGLMVEKTITWALSYDDNDFIYKKEVI